MKRFPPCYLCTMDDLYHATIAYMERHGLHKTGFGIMVSNDGHLVDRLRAGRVTWATMQKIARQLELPPKGSGKKEDEK